MRRNQVDLMPSATKEVAEFNYRRVYDFNALCSAYPEETTETLCKIVEEKSEEYLKNLVRFGCIYVPFKDAIHNCNTYSQGKINAILSMKNCDFGKNPPQLEQNKYHEKRGNK